MSEKDFEDLRDSAASILEYGGSGDYMQLMAENSASVVRADETVLSYLILSNYCNFPKSHIIPADFPRIYHS